MRFVISVGGTVIIIVVVSCVVVAILPTLRISACLMRLVRVTSIITAIILLLLLWIGLVLIRLVLLMSAAMLFHNWHIICGVLHMGWWCGCGEVAGWCLVWRICCIILLCLVVPLLSTTPMGLVVGHCGRGSNVGVWFLCSPVIMLALNGDARGGALGSEPQVEKKSNKKKRNGCLWCVYGFTCWGKVCR